MGQSLKVNAGCSSSDVITSRDRTCTPWTSTASYAAWQQLPAAAAELWDKSETNDDKHLLSVALQLLQDLQTVCQLLGAIHCFPSVCTILSCQLELLRPVPFCSQYQLSMCMSPLCSRARNYA